MRLCIAIFYLFLLGCGYNFQGSGSILPDDVKTIDIKVAENNTTQTGLGVRFTEKLRSRFERYGAVEVVVPGEDADAELITSILSVSTQVRSVTGSSDIAQELEMILTVSALLKMKNGQILYRNDLLQVSESFGSVSNVVVTSSSDFAQGNIGVGALSTLGEREVSRGQKNEAIEDALEEAARVLYLDAVAPDF